MIVGAEIDPLTRPRVTVTQHAVCSSAQELLLVALKPFTRYELAVQSNGVDVVGPFSGTVEEFTLSDSESLVLSLGRDRHLIRFLFA